MGMFDFLIKPIAENINSGADAIAPGNGYRANENPLLADQERKKRFADAIAAANGRPDVRMNMAPQNQFRQGQTDLVGQLQQQAMGQGPSVAQGAFNQANDQNIANANAMAASARGNINPAMVQRLAMQNQAQGAQNLAGQYATARAGEQVAAQDCLAGVLGNARGQDIGAAGQNATLSLQSQQMRDELIAKYEAMGLSADQAQLAAAMEAQKINAGVTSNNVTQRNQLMGGVLSGAGAAMGMGV